LAAGGLAGALVGDLVDQHNVRDLERQLEEREKELAMRKGMVKKQAEELEDLEAKLRECEKKRKELEKEIADLRKQLGDLGDEIKVRREGDKIILTILGETLYASGKAELTAQGRDVIDRAMKMVRQRFPDREILVRGHTDTQPIVHSGWDDNWELGANRALGVLRYMMKKHGVKGENISASTHSFYQPVATNDTADGRRQNRRTEIVILPKKEVVLEKPE
jgi:chemotaxis protein MotB